MGPKFYWCVEFEPDANGLSRVNSPARFHTSSESFICAEVTLVIKACAASSCAGQACILGARGSRPSCARQSSLANKRAQETPSARRTRSLACEMMEAHERSHHRFAEQSDVSCAMVLTAYPVLSPVTGLFCHRRSTDHPAKLSASVGAPGPHDFAVRDNAARRAALSRPPHPTSTFVTTRTSLLSRRDGRTQCR